jgi:hypothetical protein
MGAAAISLEMVARGGLIGAVDWTDERSESARRVSAEGANQSKHRHADFQYSVVFVC